MQGASGTYSVTATDLACRRGDRVLFAGLSFTLHGTEALQVAGTNGIGKSSLLRIVAGLAPAFEGGCTVQGTIGLLDEKPALDPALPLGRALAFWQALDCPALEGGAADTAAQLERLGLSGLLDVPVRYLSTGQKKRAAFARLLSQKAAIWLLDEPLNGLDGQAVELAETLTAEHCAAGGIALVASHQAFRMPNLRTLELSRYAA
ncbi:heme ABC exporter ATP-binding protein CcmA [Novosphingobium guangzhouense]|uniref:Heme ABC exporter, ATP-binding protein CcmA n=1 Tax=Novosphingobium guangzhouense TaxID=1850347 RepID=A0A2K2FSW4_9SPHN|nr:heme ABC exporter ATP-binding protein CcmA [Novosphingobium guangzhouense]PNU01879.1 heme ABC exporter, ATP-binding protein CcmA [Novosphingobium guangzhouense]